MYHSPPADAEGIETMTLVQTIAALPPGSVGDSPTAIALTAISALREHIAAGGDVVGVQVTVDYDTDRLRWTVVLRSKKEDR